MIGGISHVSLFYYRHKLLTALAQLDFEAFNGIVEMDETYFLYSEKGQRKIQGRKPRKRGGKAKKRGISKQQVCVLVARDRTKATVSSVLGRGRIETTQLDKAVGDKLSSTNTLCTDSWRAFKPFAKTKGIMEHYTFTASKKEHVKGIFHIQNVNNFHSRLKGWVRKFNGVATKYLQNYLAWFTYLDSIQFKTDDVFIKEFLVQSCIHRMTETNTSLRLKKFAV